MIPEQTRVGEASQPRFDLSPPLAAGAEKTAPAGDADAADCPAATGTGQSLPSVHTEVVLKGAFQSFSIPVVAHRRSLEPDRLFQDERDHPPQPEETPAAQVLDLRLRMNAGRKQDFIGIDVADPGDHVLVEKEGFDPAAAAGKKSPEAGGIQVERIRPKPAQLYRPGRSRGHERADKPEFPNVLKTKIVTGPAKRNDQMSMLGRRRLFRTEEQTARHLEVK